MDGWVDSEPEADFIYIHAAHSHTLTDEGAGGARK